MAARYAIHLERPFFCFAQISLYYESNRVEPLRLVQRGDSQGEPTLVGKLVAIWLVGVALQVTSSRGDRKGGSSSRRTGDGRANPYCTIRGRRFNSGGGRPSRVLQIPRSERSMSDYDPQSELRRPLRRSSEGKAIPVSDDLWRVLVSCARISERSQGAFE